MAENHESETDGQRIDHPILPSAKTRPDPLDIVKNRYSPETGPENDTKEAKETFLGTGQTAGQATTNSPANLSSAKQDDLKQANDRTEENSPTDSLTTMSEEEFQKAKEQQLQEDKQQYQVWEGKLQQMQKSDHDPQSSDSEDDQNEDYIYGMSQ